MSILQEKKPSVSDEPYLKKPRGLFFLEEPLIDRIYGPDALAVIARRVDLAKSHLTSGRFKSSEEKWAKVEMIFSGWGMIPMDQAFLSRFPNLKIVFYGAGSVKGCVTDDFWESGVRITNAAATNAIPVAEYTCSQIIQALKGVWQNALFIRRERRFPEVGFPPGAYQTTVGLLSLGMIGKMVAERLRSHDINIIAYDPYIKPEEAERLNVKLLPLDEIFARANVVSCHTPFLPETRRMIRGRHFERMKPNASFINTSQGGVVAEDEMIVALRQRPDLMAILDVTSPQPPVPGSALYSLDNIVMTSHIAGSMGYECRRMGLAMVGELERYLAGKPLHYELSKERTAIRA